MQKTNGSPLNAFPFVIIIILISSRGAYASENVLSLERMGAGAPGGWKVSLENAQWTPAPEPGPLGAGAARVSFQGKGRLELVGPAKALPAGTSFAAALWVRSKPAGAMIAFDLRDNENEKPIALHGETVATGEWQLIRTQEILPPSVTGHYYLELTASGTDATVYLDGLWLGSVDGPLDDSWRPATQEAGVVLEPVAPWGVVNGNAEQRVRARVCGVTRPGRQILLRATNTLGTFSDLPAVPIDGNGFCEKEIPITDAVAHPFGMLRVEGHVVDALGKPVSTTCETLLARAPEPLPGPMPESYFGVHVSLREPDLEAVARLGYKWCRIHDASAITKWGYVEPEPGNWIWHDDEVDLARKHGLSILGMFDTAPAWETGAEDSGYFQVCHAPKDIGKWREYVRQMTGHYAGRIDAWEVWNEPWDMMRFFQGGTPFLYVDLLKTAWEEAKAVNPGATIVGINTYPSFWEDMVLASGAYPFYDKLSWHRYDPAMLGRPGDGISRVARRLETIQRAVGGTPKPILCSEGGPDVGRYHGSFFSFAEPGLWGPWDEGADRYARFCLSAIAAGNERYIAYSVHSAPRHGWLTHNMIEPQYLLKPMHLAMAALAYFVDGAPYAGRLVPAPGISAHLFTHSQPRSFAATPCTVAVLHSDGVESISLPRPIPEGVRCFDRWANPLDTPPTEAARGLVYLVAEGEDIVADLQDALSAPPGEAPVASTPDALLDALVRALTTGTPPLWTLCSVQGSALFTTGTNGPVAETRATLQSAEAGRCVFSLPVDTSLVSKSFRNAQSFIVCLASLQSGDRSWTLSLNAAQDAPETPWKLLSLTLLPEAAEKGVSLDAAALQPVRVWDACLREGKTDPLYATLYDGPCSMGAATRNGEYMVFTRADYLVTMLKTVLMWGSAGNTPVALDTAAFGTDLAIAAGTWDISSLAFGMGRYTIVATLIHTSQGWRLASLCVGPDERPE